MNLPFGLSFFEINGLKVLQDWRNDTEQYCLLDLAGLIFEHYSLYSCKRNNLISQISLTKRTSLFLMLFSKWIIRGKHGEIEVTSSSNTSIKSIHLFQLSRSLAKQKPNKSGMCSQTYSWTIFIPLSRIRAQVFSKPKC